MLQIYIVTGPPSTAGGRSVALLNELFKALDWITKRDSAADSAGSSGSDAGSGAAGGIWSFNPFDPLKHADPLVLDLNGDGIQTTSSATYFDYAGDGFAKKTGWVNSKDGMLVRDINGDGIINNGGELFGDQTVLANGNYAKDGVAALAALDNNGDGVVDGNDTAWSELKVWVDTDGDGVTDSGELHTLSELGIKSLNVSSTTTNTTDSAGNTQIALGNYTKEDGTVGQMGDYSFVTDKIHTIATEYLSVSEDVLQIAYLPGHGTVYDSWQAMMRDTSGILKSLIQSFAAETDATVRSSILDQILYQWTDSETIVSNSRGSNIDARQLTVLEKLYGQDYVGVGGSNPNVWSGPILSAKYKNVKEYYDGWLMVQTHFADLFKSITYSLDESNNIIMNFSTIQTRIQSDLTNNYQQGKEELAEFATAAGAIGLTSNCKEYNNLCNYFISQSEDLALAIYSAGRTTIFGTTGNDSLYGDGADDVLFGGEGNDTLYADGGNVVLDGGNGNDTLYGNKGISDNRWGEGASNGDVTYLWGKGDGNDTIINVVNDSNLSQDKNGGQSIVQLGAGITKDSIDIVQSGDDLILSIKETGETLEIKNWCISNFYKMDAIYFADGTSLTTEQIIGGVAAKQLDNIGVKYTESDAGIITIDFTDTQDKIQSMLASDYENGKLLLQKVIHTVNLLNQSQTNDFVKFSSSFINQSEELAYIVYSTDRTVTLGSDGNDSLSGTAKNEYFIAGAGNDTLDGGAGNDILDGGTGNDKVCGGRGNDIYVWGTGSGNDVIDNSTSQYYDSATNSYKWYDNGQDTVQFGAGLTKDSISFVQNDEDIVFTNKATGETLKIVNWFANDTYKVETFQFADGTKWTAEEITNNAVVQGGSGSDYLYGSDYHDDKIYGGDGSDRLYGYAGNDTLYGEAGDDYLSGGSGNDILDGGTGNDTLAGGVGDDIYVWGSGSGNDKIDNSSSQYYDSATNSYKWYDNGQDTVQFGIGLTKDSISFVQNGNDIVFTNKATGETLTIDDWFVSEQYKIETFQFADGTKWTAEDITNTAVVQGGSGNDTLYGSQYHDDKIYGGSGNDTLYGYAGNDILDGGAGNDALYGGAGDDTYAFEEGSGNDTINNYSGSSGHGFDTLQFQNLTQAALEFTVSGSDLICTVSQTGENARISNWTLGSNYQVDSFKFSDGTLTAADINKKSAS